ncbi:hypothetical protein PR048_017052 [Dryococelus australis]|uniref:Uncharacterized protein n=1 Tax=Dryococelus australis TaxID=614101 RepID=A0ABQ9H8H5_9NEOP|nr:hypothetical protein PR048_017052 [Dryococelus australis]
MQGRGKREIPRKTRRPSASSGTISHLRISGRLLDGAGGLGDPRRLLSKLVESACIRCARTCKQAHDTSPRRPCAACWKRRLPVQRRNMPRLPRRRGSSGEHNRNCYSGEQQRPGARCSGPLAAPLWDRLKRYCVRCCTYSFTATINKTPPPGPRTAIQVGGWGPEVGDDGPHRCHKSYEASRREKTARDFSALRVKANRPSMHLSRTPLELLSFKALDTQNNSSQTTTFTKLMRSPMLFQLCRPMFLPVCQPLPPPLPDNPSRKAAVASEREDTGASARPSQGSTAWPRTSRADNGLVSQQTGRALSLPQSFVLVTRAAHRPSRAALIEFSGRPAAFICAQLWRLEPAHFTVSRISCGGCSQLTSQSAESVVAAAASSLHSQPNQPGFMNNTSVKAVHDKLIDVAQRGSLQPPPGAWKLEWSPVIQKGERGIRRLHLRRICWGSWERGRVGGRPLEIRFSHSTTGPGCSSAREAVVRNVRRCGAARRRGRRFGKTNGCRCICKARNTSTIHPFCPSFVTVARAGVVPMATPSPASLPSTIINTRFTPGFPILLRAAGIQTGDPLRADSPGACVPSSDAANCAAPNPALTHLFSHGITSLEMHLRKSTVKHLKFPRHQTGPVAAVTSRDKRFHVTVTATAPTGSYESATSDRDIELRRGGANDKQSPLFVTATCVSLSVVVTVLVMWLLLPPPLTHDTTCAWDDE